MGDTAPRFSRPAGEPWPSQPHRTLAEVQTMVAAPAPDAEQVSELLELLHEELQEHFAHEQAHDDELQAALPFGTPHVTYRGESRLQQQHALLEQVDVIARHANQLAEAKAAAVGWPQLHEQLAQFGQQLNRYEARNLPPLEPPSGMPAPPD